MSDHIPWDHVDFKSAPPTVSHAFVGYLIGRALSGNDEVRQMIEDWVNNPERATWLHGVGAVRKEKAR